MNSDQIDELEALRSIFDGDSAFHISDENSNIQYRFGEPGHGRSFILEIRWPQNYPLEADPEINLDVFYNKHLNAETKAVILRNLRDESLTLHGGAMTYSLIEFVRENFDRLTNEQPEILTTKSNAEIANNYSSDEEKQDTNNAEKSEKLSKAQKRKMWNRGGEEKQRGWNWVDIVKHLSQTGQSANA